VRARQLLVARRPLVFSKAKQFLRSLWTFGHTSCDRLRLHRLQKLMPKLRSVDHLSCRLHRAKADPARHISRNENDAVGSFATGACEQRGRPCPPCPESGSKVETWASDWGTVASAGCGPRPKAKTAHFLRSFGQGGTKAASCRFMAQGAKVGAGPLVETLTRRVYHDAGEAKFQTETRKSSLG
jgi:hypothetical protein